MRFLSVLFLALMVMPFTGYAADAPAAAVKQDPADLDKRIELATKLHGVMPLSVRDQINLAVDQAAQGQPEKEREVFRSNMKNILNYQALEKISIEAMAEVYTPEELQVQIDYYSKPEAKSANAKYDQYAQKVFPEITRMLDQALMRVRTGGTGQ